jgi:hypothetical protein
MRKKLIASLCLALGLGGASWETFAVSRDRNVIAALRLALEAAKERRRNDLEALQSDRADAAVSTTENRDPSLAHFDESLREVFLRKRRLQEWFGSHPDKSIPETQYLNLTDWLVVVTKGPLDTDSELRVAAGRAREIGEQHFAEKLGLALARYVAANAKTMPGQIFDLVPYFNPPVSLSMLQRYEILIHGAGDTMAATNMAAGLAPASLVDPQYERGAVFAGASGYVLTSDGSGMEVSDEIARHQAMAGFANAHRGQLSFEFKDIAPYFANPSDALKWQVYYDERKHAVP